MLRRRVIQVISICLSLQFSSSIFSQTRELSSSIRFLSDNVIEANLSCDGFLISNKCATYRRVMPVDNQLRTHGVVEDYTLSGIVIGKTHYEKGVKNGPVKGYYSDGAIRFEGQFFSNVHANVWKFYYPDGSLEKTIRYENGVPRLMHFSNEKGKLLIRNGSGSFRGIVMIKKLSCNEFIVSGNVRNGFMHGKWIVEDKYTGVVLYQENYINGRFIEGRYTDIPNTPKYFKNPKCSFVGYQLLENAYYFADASCAEDMNFSMYGNSIALEAAFYPELIELITNNLNQTPALSGRALIDLEFKIQDGLSDVNIHSTFDPSTEDALKKIIESMDKWNTEYMKNDEDRFFILAVDDGEVFIPDYTWKTKSSAKGDHFDLIEYEFGKTREGKKVGIWSYYDSNGELELKVDYSKPSIIFYKPDTSKYLVITADNTWDETYVDRQPMYLGSSKLYHDEVSKKLSYPNQALKKKVSGTSLFSFEINTNGYAENLKIIDDIGSGTKNMVESALNSVENKWIPAIMDGKTSKIHDLYSSRFSTE